MNDKSGQENSKSATRTHPFPIGRSAFSVRYLPISRLCSFGKCKSSSPMHNGGEFSIRGLNTAVGSRQVLAKGRARLLP